MARIAFVDSRYPWRSLLAAAFGHEFGSDHQQIVAVSLVGGHGDRDALADTIAGAGYPSGSSFSMTRDAFLTQTFDVVVSLDADAAADMSSLPGRPEIVGWQVRPNVDPGAGDDTAAVLAEEAPLIRSLVRTLYRHGFLAALESGRRFSALLLDGMSDGLLVHDHERRIVLFNAAAEAITEYSADEVIGRDCHDVFPGNLCGAKCLFCEDAAEPPPRRGTIEICTKSGESRWVEMFVRLLEGPTRNGRAVVVSFHDVTREQQLARRVGDIQNFAGIIGQDESMLEIFDLVHDLADAAVPVLIRGESGTGKELIAAAIHNEGPRANRLFIPVNCGALPESLLESELFGHIKGSFTGAIRDKKGRFELADGGTIFLDEIGDISPMMQVKLLRVLQEGTFERVGSEETLKVNVRVISATNKDLEQEIEEGRFREDLFYRLNVVPVYLPPLRERRMDIPLLIDHVLYAALRDSRRGPVTLSDEARDVMLSYDWPGNVRELQNWIQFALVKCRGTTIYPEHLPPPRPGATHDKPKHRRKLDIEAVRSALKRAKNNKVKAARLLGVSRATLYRFLDDVSL